MNIITKYIKRYTVHVFIMVTIMLTMFACLRKPDIKKTSPEYGGLLSTADSFFEKNENDSSLKYRNLALYMAPDSTSYYHAVTGIAWTYMQKGDWKLAKMIAEKAFAHFMTCRHDSCYLDHVFILRILSSCERIEGDQKQSLRFILKARKSCEELGDTLGLIECYSEIGSIERFLRNITSAIDSYNKALELCDSNPEKYMEMKVYALIGICAVYEDLGDYKTAEKFLKLSHVEISNLSNTLQLAYYTRKMYVAIAQKRDTEARMYLEKMRKANNAIGTIAAAENFTHTACEFFINYMQFDSAQFYLDTKKDLFKEKSTNKVLDDITIQQSEILLGIGSYEEARKLIREHEFSKYLKQNNKGHIRMAKLSERYFLEIGDYWRAYLSAKYRRNIEDSIALKNQSQLLANKQLQYRREVAILQNNAQITDKTYKINRLVHYQVICIIVLFIIALTIVCWILWRRNKLAKERQMLAVRESRMLESEVLRQTEILKKQSDELNLKNQSIIESIAYAKHIQQCMLPDIKKLTTSPIKESFVIYKPLSIVSGDFYWFANVGTEVYVCCADCTGHGVPGAFLAMMCGTILNDIINSSTVSPMQIVRELDSHMRSMLGKNEQIPLSDTIDMSIISINKDTLLLRSCSARRPVIVVSDNEHIVIPFDKRSVGDCDCKFLNRSFTEHTVQLKKDDCIYLFTDGVTDQFGSDHDKMEKYKMKRFKEMLLEYNQKSMNEQKRLMEQTIAQWRNGMEQTDDVLIMGMRV